MSGFTVKNGQIYNSQPVEKYAERDQACCYSELSPCGEIGDPIADFGEEVCIEAVEQYARNYQYGCKQNTPD